MRHLRVAKVRGRFDQISGAIGCDRYGHTSIEGSVEVASIDTGDERRDRRLCAEDFFDAERYPTISFKAISEAVHPDEISVVSGDDDRARRRHKLELQLDGPGPPVATNGDLRIRATGVLSGRVFGFKWDSAFAAGGLVIDDRVGLHLDIVLRPGF